MNKFKFIMSRFIVQIFASKLQKISLNGEKQMVSVNNLPIRNAFLYLYYHKTQTCRQNFHITNITA